MYMCKELEEIEYHAQVLFKYCHMVRRRLDEIESSLAEMNKGFQGLESQATTINKTIQMLQVSDAEQDFHSFIN